MKLSSIVVGLAAIGAASCAPLEKRANTTSASNSTESASNNKTILLTNDDGWAALNIRAAYRELKAAGYQVILSAPASQRSGWSGRFVIPDKTLDEDGEFEYVKKGDPAWGHEDDDENIWYFGGTPASSVAFGLEYLVPKYFNDTTVDLIVSGPNEGTNLSPGMYTISGTIGATYNSVYRGVPGIAFSGSNGNNSFFKDFEGRENDDTLAANIYAKKVVEIVDTLFEGAKNNKGLLPVTTGLNVNFPKVGEDADDCTDPKWVYTRLSGPKSTASDLKWDEDSESFKYNSGEFDSLAEKVFGNLYLYSEAEVLAKGECETSVSAFSIDYDASLEQSNIIHDSLESLF